MQVLPADMMKTTHQSPSEEAPGIFHPVSRDSVLDEPNAMIDNPMATAHPAEFGVGPKLIGVQFDVGQIEPFPSRFDDASLLDVRDVLRADAARAVLSGTDDNRPIGSPSDSRSPIFRPKMSARVVFVHLHDALKQVGHALSHCLSDAMDHVPAAFLADLQFPLHLERAKRLLGIQHDEDGQKPLPQPNVGLVEDRAGRNRETVAALQARPLLPALQLAHLIRMATRALHALRPADADQVLSARFVVGKLLNQFDQIHGLRLSFAGARPVRMLDVRGIQADTPVCSARRPLARLPGFLSLV
jgi:hypothetical protein